MTDKFTPEQIEQIKAAIDKHHGTNWCAFTALVITELTKPEWEPAVGQIVHNTGTGSYYVCSGHGAISKTLIPVTTKQAGTEPMLHLIDAIEGALDITSGSDDPDLRCVRQLLNDVIVKHEELMQ